MGKWIFIFEKYNQGHYNIHRGPFSKELTSDISACNGL